MMTPRLFIVDDEAPARARLATLLSDIAADCPHVLIGSADNAQDALDGIAREKPDIVLLDVQMPGMTGIELAMHLARNAADAPAIIFITAHDGYALQAFEVHALDYLLKPVRASRLAHALQRVADMRTDDDSQRNALTAAAGALQTRRRHFFVQERGRLLLVPISEVLYLKAEQKYVTLRTGMRDYLIEESLLSLEEELGDTFVRVHRNALVARDAILGIERGAITTDADADRTQDAWQVIVRDTDERLPVSRRQLQIIKALVRR
ncbi:MAG TPA: LytTR family DNA-binding domain-containing protein [Burkholderiaceae bacterium]|nr:LytTR family DNA-binding domain-containing protein [Burkholderiaceae bacterium]